MNSINLIGNICNDLELKTTNSGKSVCSFNLAVRRPFSVDTTDFFTVVVWNKQAENLFNFCHKGSKVGVTGTLTTRKYEDKEGITRTVYEVLANAIEFLDSKGEGKVSKNGSDAVGSDAFGEGIDASGFMAMGPADGDLPF